MRNARRSNAFGERRVRNPRVQDKNFNKRLRVIHCRFVVQTSTRGGEERNPRFVLIIPTIDDLVPNRFSHSFSAVTSRRCALIPIQSRPSTVDASSRLRNKLHKMNLSSYIRGVTSTEHRASGRAADKAEAKTPRSRGSESIIHEHHKAPETEGESMMFIL